MSQSTSKVLVVLLAAVLVLQLYSLSRQGGLDRRVAQLSSEVAQQESRLFNDISSMQSRLYDLAEAERWVSVANVAVDQGPACGAADVRINWELMNWAPDTRSRLVYRVDESGAWQEAAVESLGAQSYVGRFTVDGAPVVQPSVEVTTHVSRNSMGVQVEETASVGGNSDYQYQILAEGPAGSRSTGAQNLDVAKVFRVSPKVRAEVLGDQRYEATVLTKPEPDVCARVEAAAVRAYGADGLAGTYPLQTAGHGELQAAWQSDVPLVRLEFVLTVNGKEEVVPVHL